MPKGYPIVPHSKPLGKEAVARIRRSGNWEYTEGKALDVIDKIAQGNNTLKEILLEAGISTRTWNYWLTQNNELQKAVNTARQLSAFAMEDDALHAGRHLMKNAETVTAPAVAAYRAFMEQLRWSAARRNPAEYGDKQVVSMKVPIQINTTLNLNGDGTEEIPDIYTIDLEAQPKLEFHPDGKPPDDRTKSRGRGIRGPASEESGGEETASEEEPIR